MTPSTATTPPPPTPLSQRQAALWGIAFTVLACAGFAVQDAAIKAIGVVLSIWMALFLRFTIQSVLTTGFVLVRRGPSALRTQYPQFQVLRALLFCGTGTLGFASIQSMPLAEFTAIIATTPLCVTLVAALVLRQRVSPLRWCLVALGLAGALIIIRPGASSFSLAMLLPLGTLCTGTAYQVLSSRMAGKEPPETTQFYTGWLATLFLGCTLPWTWQTITEPWVWGLAFLIGLASATSHMLMLNAYARATPATIAPFLYTQIAFALIVGWLLYRHLPDGWSVVGMVTIAASGAASTWLTLRETR